MDTHILIVDDDPFMTKLLLFILTDHGYRTTIADSRQVTSYLQENSVDLLLLDVMLPYLDGFSICSAVRQAHPDLPIIFLSAHTTLTEKLDGFDHGADDYIAKPFEPTVLIARIEAVLRRCRRAARDGSDTVITVGATRLDLVRQEFSAPTCKAAALTPTEMKMLECLMRNANMVITREMLIERTGTYDFGGDRNRVDVYIRRLRKKIEARADEPVLIETVRGIGYVFRASRQDGSLPLHNAPSVPVTENEYGIAD